jgi:transposase-like protein
MVGTDPVRVDGLLAAGQLRCPGCTGRLGPWGHARSRSVREQHGPVRHRPRRTRCSSCGRTHVLLAASMLLRRADGVLVIGAALLAKAAGAGHRTVAAGLGRPAGTVRGWLRRFARRAEQLRVLFTGLLHALDASAGPLTPTASTCGDALQALGAAAAAAVRRFGPRCPWQFTAAASGGLLLAPDRAVR